MDAINFFKELNATDIIFALLRNSDELVDSAGDTDIDLIVSSLHRKEIELFICRYAENRNGCALGICRTPTMSKIFTIWRESDSSWTGMRFDISFEIAYLGAVVLINEKQVLEERSQLKAIPQIEHLLSQTLGALKSALHTTIIAQKYLDDSIRFLEDPKSLHRTEFSFAVRNSFEDLLSVCIAAKDGKEIGPLCKKLRRKILLHAISNSPIEFAKKFTSTQINKVQRFFYPSGTTICVLGTDGSGKSTFIQQLLPIFKKATHGDVFVNHLRPGYLRPLSKLFRRPSSNDSDSVVVTNPHSGHSSGIIGSIIRALWLWLDYHIGHWLKIRRLISQSPGIVIFDRYSPDLEIDQKRFKINLPHPFRRFLWKLTPHCDISFCLIADPILVNQRKPELSLEETSRQIEVLSSICGSCIDHVPIQTDIAVQDSRDLALRELIRKKTIPA